MKSQGANCVIEVLWAFTSVCRQCHFERGCVYLEWHFIAYSYCYCYKIYWFSPCTVFVVFKTVLVPFCITIVQNLVEKNRNVLLPGDFLCRIFLALPFSSFLPSFSFCAFLFIFYCARVPLGHSGLFIQCTPNSLLLCGTCTASSYLFRLRAAWQTSRTYVVDTWISMSLRFVGLSWVSHCLITPCCIILHGDQSH